MALRTRLNRREARAIGQSARVILAALEAQIEAVNALRASAGVCDLYGSRIKLRDLHRSLEPVTDSTDVTVALEEIGLVLREGLSDVKEIRTPNREEGDI